MNNLGQKIKEQRIKKGLTQQEFAELLYVSDKTISSYECNRTVPDINMLFKISNILDINLYNLIDNNFNSLDNLEIEVKLKVNISDFNRIKGIIKNQNSNITKIKQIDKYYIPKYRNFNYEWLRVRNEENKCILTYKKKIINNCCKEYEVLIDNVNSFETILKCLDFQNKGIITKTREKIMYNDKYEFSFDNVDNMGNFDVFVLIEHNPNLTTISPTQMDTFENLAQADIAGFLWNKLKLFQDLQTVFANVNMRLEDLQEQYQKREEIMNYIKESYVSAANKHQPLMFCI